MECITCVRRASKHVLYVHKLPSHVTEIQLRDLVAKWPTEYVGILQKKRQNTSDETSSSVLSPTEHTNSHRFGKITAFSLHHAYEIKAFLNEYYIGSTQICCNYENDTNNTTTSGTEEADPLFATSLLTANCTEKNASSAYRRHWKEAQLGALAHDLQLCARISERVLVSAMKAPNQTQCMGLQSCIRLLNLMQKHNQWTSSIVQRRRFFRHSAAIQWITSRDRGIVGKDGNKLYFEAAEDSSDDSSDDMDVDQEESVKCKQVVAYGVVVRITIPCCTEMIQGAAIQRLPHDIDRNLSTVELLSTACKKAIRKALVDAIRRFAWIVPDNTTATPLATVLFAG